VGVASVHAYPNKATHIQYQYRLLSKIWDAHLWSNSDHWHSMQVQHCM